MTHSLKQTNPARIWLREKFETPLRLVSGRLIVVRFDLASCGRGRMWDADRVMTHFDPTFLVDKEDNFGEYLSIASTIADVLNQQMQLEADEILAQIKMSFAILDALSVNDITTAYLRLASLADRLLPYTPRSTEIWGAWITTAYMAIKSADDSEGGLDVVI